MNAKRSLTCFLLVLLVLSLCAGALVAWIDPFFHYHAPHTDRFFYTIDNERSMNDGIAKHFDFDAIVTGSSMVANFKTSEVDEIFGTHSVKLPLAGGSFYEIADLLETAFAHHPEVKCVIRSIDRHLLFFAVNERRTDLGEYPDYLFDRNPLNDYKYLLSADVLFHRCFPMLLRTRQPGFVPGHTSFDVYDNTMKYYEGYFGLPDIRSLFWYEIDTVGEPIHMDESTRALVTENITRNVVAVAEAHPDVTFYCYLPPYSVGYWHNKLAVGDIYQQIEAETLAVELMLQCANIRLFDFSGRDDIISDVNNYRDLLHYGDWINSFILQWMHDDRYRLTKENYEDFLADRLAYYRAFDYSTLLTQERWHSDLYAGALLNEELTGVAPRRLGEEELLAGELRNARLEADPESGEPVLHCTGVILRDVSQDLGNYLRDVDYVGLKLTLPDAGTYSYLSFRGRNTGFNGQPAVFAYDADGVCVASLERACGDLIGDEQVFTLDLRDAKGPVTVIFNGGYPEQTGHPASSFEFRDFTLY